MFSQREWCRTIGEVVPSLARTYMRADNTEGVIGLSSVTSCNDGYLHETAMLWVVRAADW